MDPQTGHGYIVGVGIDEGDRDPASPVPDNGALFPGKPASCLFDFIPTHKATYQVRLFPATIEEIGVYRYYSIGDRP